ncbi:MAG: CapA family protein [Bacteroidetes bacterium]|nr:CapA family protein [Bacteroidota bacterium]
MKTLVVILSVWLTSLQVKAQDTLSVSLTFTGDIMQHDTQIYGAFDPLTGRYDYKPCFEKIRAELSEADLTIGNLELTLGGPPYKGYPQFSAPDELLEGLKYAGYDVLVTANNHSVDRGKKGLERTVRLLDSAGFQHTGTFRDTLEWLNEYPLILKARGFSFSLLNYTYGTNGLKVYPPNIVNRIDRKQIKNDLEKAKAQGTDAIIVFMHWGLEYKSLPDSSQQNLADFCFRNGAKLVIGAHPHVLQPMEWKKESDQLVAYSLGNFVSAQYDRYKNGGAILHVTLKKPAGGTAASIADVSYSLEYVYRAANQRMTYHILPLHEFENDTTFVRRKAAHDYMIQFRDDSRLLLGRENKNVRERNFLAQPSQASGRP